MKRYCKAIKEWEPIAREMQLETFCREWNKDYDDCMVDRYFLCYLYSQSFRSLSEGLPLNMYINDIVRYSNSKRRAGFGLLHIVGLTIVFMSSIALFSIILGCLVSIGTDVSVGLAVSLITLIIGAVVVVWVMMLLEKWWRKRVISADAVIDNASKQITSLTQVILRRKGLCNE